MKSLQSLAKWLTRPQRRAAMPLLLATLACQPRPPSEQPKQEAAEAAGPAANAEPATAAVAPAVAATAAGLPHEPTPIATPVPPPPAPVVPPPPVKAKMVVLVSDTAPESGGRQLLSGYERLGKSKNRELVEVNTDHNAVEFPSSLTAAQIRGAKVGKGEGAGLARALQLDFTMVDQHTPFAGCGTKTACGCEDIKPYSYISLSHALPPEAHASDFKWLSLWARSQEPYDLHLILSCFVEPRPMDTVPPNNGYLDAAHTQMDPCWHSPRVELPLSDPIAIRGDNQWHRYQVRIADLPPSEPVTLTGGAQMVCTLEKVTHVVYVLKKNHPALPGEYPKDQGSVYFDNLEGLIE